MWFNLAAANRVENSVERRDILARRMTPFPPNESVFYFLKLLLLSSRQGIFEILDAEIHQLALGLMKTTFRRPSGFLEGTIRSTP